MFLTKMSLPRRSFLKGVGATFALPLLDAMLPALSTRAQAQAVAPTLRFGAVYLPQGFVLDQWIPAEAGANFEFKPIMKPLEPFRDQLVAVSGLDGAANGGTGTHATGPASYLNGVIPKRTEGNDIFAGITIDQAIAKQIGQDTMFPSMELATEDFSGAVGACETGYSCLYMNTISWATPTAPLPMEINPRVVFERMFGGTGTLEQRLTRMRQNRSILDAVMQQSNQLQAGLGSRDRELVTNYLDNIREIERRIQKAESQRTSEIATPELPGAIPDNFGEHVALMFDLLHVAYQADITRVFTFMMARELHGRTYPELGANEGHHSLSHHSWNPEKMAKFAATNTYHTSLFANFVQKLKDTKDGDGNLLDHSLLVYGNGMGWGTVHGRENLPYVVVGGANGRIRGNRHLVHPRDTSNANLLLALGQKAGVELTKFGQSTAAVDL
jgi:hypothetical protein